MHGVARILLDRVIHNVQVSWVKMGVRACQTILGGGANDFGGTLMEETISRMAGAEWGIRMEPSQIRDAITAIGRIPVERSTTYEPLQRNAFTHTRAGGREDEGTTAHEESTSKG
jgi:2-iminoacetate synthase ThiH